MVPVVFADALELMLNGDAQRLQPFGLANPGDGVCATTQAVCTLRAAVQEAAASGKARTIALGAGTYRLEYSVVSQDLDDNFGDFVFVVEPGSDVATDCADQTVESDSSVVPTVLTVVVPILVAGVAIAFLNRWARRRSDGAAAEADDSTD